MRFVRFDERLTRGKKRGVKRGVRFVLMELSLEAYEGAGTIELPREMDTLDALHDLIGGNRKEIEIALETFAADPIPDENALVIVRNDREHRLTVASWAVYNPSVSSKHRVRKHRENKKLQSDVTLQKPQPGNAGNALQIREDEIREEKRGGALHAPLRAEANPHPDPEVRKLVAAIEAEPKFSSIPPPDIRALAARAMPVGKRKPVAWHLNSVKEAAADTPTGEQAHVTQKRLRAYLDRSKAPQKNTDEQTSQTGPQYREFEFEDGELDAVRTQTRRTIGQ